MVILVSCVCNENYDVSNELNFVSIDYNKTDGSFQIKENLIRYREILAYDSAQHVFQLNEKAWELIKSKITPVYPDPNFGFGVTIGDELIYKVSYIPGYHSYSYPEVIKFTAIDNNCVLLYYGHYSGEIEINDDRIIELLSKDGKLKKINL